MAIRPITLSPEQRANLKPIGGELQGGALSQLTGAGEMSPLQRIMGLGVMTGKVKPTTVSALSSLGFLPSTQEAKETRKRKTDAKTTFSGYSEALRRISEAKQLVQSTKEISGGAGRSKVARSLSERYRGLRPILKMVGGGGAESTETQQLNTILSFINEKLFETAGKAITGTETELLRGRILDVGLEEDILLDRLNALEKEALLQQEQILSLE